MKAYSITVSVLFLFILMSAFSLVYIKHKSRTLYTQLQSLKKEQYSLDDQWGRLLLEQSAALSHGKVEKVARNKLGMKQPKKIVVIR